MLAFEMFYEYAILATTLIGSFVGGWIDLKTTEVPDSVPLFIAISALFLHVANGIFGAGWETLLWGVGASIAYLAFGYLMFYTGQWGEADVLLLAAIIFAIPQPLSFFNMQVGLSYPLIFLINTFIAGAVYSMIYGIVIATRTKNFWSLFKKELAESKIRFVKILSIVVLGIIAITLFFGDFGNSSAGLALFIIITVGLIYLLFAFAKTIDKNSFKKKISSKQLREGDVLATPIPELKMTGKLFVGLTMEDIKKIQKAKKTVEIKEGIRYTMAFFFAILATMFFGSLLPFLILG